ncbi:hypothetical protein Trydic_g16718 [Trypoxylus dichotomus]
MSQDVNVYESQYIINENQKKFIYTFYTYGPSLELLHQPFLEDCRIFCVGRVYISCYVIVHWSVMDRFQMEK